MNDNNSEQTVETDESNMNGSEQQDSQQQADTESTETSESPDSGDVNVDELKSSPDQHQLDQQLEEALQQATDSQDKMLRTQAEMENLRKRTERDVSNAHKYAVEKFANEILQVKDSLELGLLSASEGAEDIDVAKLQEGTTLTLKILGNVFEKFAIEELNPVGEAFDPNLHEAMTMQESAEHDPNTVLTVVQKGYTLHGRLIRPAMVIVSKASG